MFYLYTCLTILCLMSWNRTLEVRVLFPQCECEHDCFNSRDKAEAAPLELCQFLDKLVIEGYSTETLSQIIPLSELALHNNCSWVPAIPLFYPFQAPWKAIRGLLNWAQPSSYPTQGEEPTHSSSQAFESFQLRPRLWPNGQHYHRTWKNEPFKETNLMDVTCLQSPDNKLTKQIYLKQLLYVCSENAIPVSRNCD